MLARIKKFFTNDNFEFTGFDKTSSTCKLEMWRSEEYKTGKLIRYIILISKISTNKGTSAFNMSDYLATIIYQWLELKSPLEFLWFEIIPKRGTGRFIRKEELLIVKFKFNSKNKGSFFMPQKTPYKQMDFFNLIGKK